MSPTKEEGQFDTLENMPVITKKPKRSKRSLFTRFKNPTSKLDAPIEDNATNIPPVAEESKNDIESASNSIIGNTSTHGSSIGGSTPSISGVNVMDSSASEASHQQSQLQSSEPDYAALFENVGKRKNITYRKPKPKVKDESLSTETSNTAGEQPTSSSLLNFGRSRSKEGSARSSIKQDNVSEQFSGENLSVASSNVSSTNQDLSHESEQQDSSTPSTPTTSTIASASKRILGSKLMPKKKSASKQLSAKDAVLLSLDTPVATMISKGVEVEVDLRSLDLPPDTKIFPTSIINSKNRTRGRKENKEADMVDETKIYLCNYCSRRFKRHEHLKRHFRSLHTFEKPYDCSICHKKFSRSDNLNQHLKIHKQEEEMAHMDQMEEVEVEDE
ncbi:uncharacterized protein SPAPADRAFT_59332 [Spathaspora passalidarum NRRL Y-27907]|uniref:C2H2-type domain-containing protein n=1 Tax=Spathaspora passalidarum (strain NRRL Y-27907 / 11-Y1) TaxID=619300 RepID=G3AJP3_SPAPN|nr:uncharacterized protein SPAPADRAFT_59332 [Spathaspora passalidarum NRRL Y-27907]EGW33944.1 hypothetical protein SPAPADRAFT_59332 [Spathaspora passalidarum NRRL Y-27907]